jgi:hypothetical protein
MEPVVAPVQREKRLWQCLNYVFIDIGKLLV